MSLRVRRFFAAACGLACLAAPVHAQTPAGTAFSYQGRLTDNGAPASGVYDLQFALFDASSGSGLVAGPLVVDDATVTNGLFTVSLDFGSSAFTGQARWLEIAVRPGASTGAFTPLAARQVISPAPHAVFSQFSQSSQTSQSSDSSLAAPWTGISGMPAGFADGVDNDLLGGLACGPNAVPKSNGATWVCGVDADASNAWSLAGNAAPGGSFLGTTSNTPLELRANGTQALLLIPDVNGASVIGGSATNTVGAGIAAAAIGGGVNNSVTAAYGTVAGGFSNSVTASYSTVAGGNQNGASGSWAAVAGGSNNQASGAFSSITGGQQNIASGPSSAVVGGLSNTASGSEAVTIGGLFNVAAGKVSFAAGLGAFALHDGTFVWNGAAGGVTVSTTGPGQFVAIAPGGFWFGKTGNPTFAAGVTINTPNGAHLTDSGTWVNASDRNLKEHFEPLDGRQLLDRLARLPITRWNYKIAPAEKHVGPMAQDFQAVFGLGRDDKSISTIDPAGLALRAIQQLDQENRALRERIDKLEGVITAMQAQAQAAPRTAR
jgi:trimeric autotransporter adhesin